MTRCAVFDATQLEEIRNFIADKKITVITAIPVPISVNALSGAMTTRIWIFYDKLD